MNFNLSKPCKNCPYRTDCLNGWLGKARAVEIFRSITKDDATFPCHKTTTEGGQSGKREEHCAGALILLEKLEEPNQMMRIAERLKFYDHFKLDMSAPVFDTGADFIEHHT